MALLDKSCCFLSLEGAQGITLVQSDWVRSCGSVFFWLFVLVQRTQHGTLQRPQPASVCLLATMFMSMFMFMFMFMFMLPVCCTVQTLSFCIFRNDTLLTKILMCHTWPHTIAGTHSLCNWRPCTEWLPGVEGGEGGGGLRLP